MLCLVTQSCPTLCHLMDCSPLGSSVHGDSSGKNTGVGCHALLQGIFPIQGSNTGLPYCRQFLYCLSHQGSPRILEWVAYPFSTGSSQPRNQTRVSCIVGRLFTSWAAREAEIHGNTVQMNLFCELYLSICLRSFSFTMNFSFFACWLFSSSALHFFSLLLKLLPLLREVSGFSSLLMLYFLIAEWLWICFFENTYFSTFEWFGVWPYSLSISSR